MLEEERRSATLISGKAERPSSSSRKIYRKVETKTQAHALQEIEVFYHNGTEHLISNFCFAKDCGDHFKRVSTSLLYHQS